jgi:hypothetical protein
MAAKKPTKMKASKTKGRAKAKAKAAPALQKSALNVRDALRVNTD